MILSEQQAAVQTWSRRAEAASARRDRHRAAIHRWKQKRFANPASLGLAFAAGMWWGSGRDFDPRASHNTKLLLGIANTSLLFWRFFGAAD